MRQRCNSNGVLLTARKSSFLLQSKTMRIRATGFSRLSIDVNVRFCVSPVIDCHTALSLLCLFVQSQLGLAQVSQLSFLNE